LLSVRYLALSGCSLKVTVLERTKFWDLLATLGQTLDNRVGNSRDLDRLTSLTNSWISGLSEPSNCCVSLVSVGLPIFLERSGLRIDYEL
jgi:hypothetical protein